MLHCQFHMQVEPAVYHGSPQFQGLHRWCDWVTGSWELWVQSPNVSHKIFIFKHKWKTGMNSHSQRAWIYSFSHSLVFSKAKGSFLQNKVLVLFCPADNHFRLSVIKDTMHWWIMGQIRVLSDKRTLYNLSEGLKKI